MNKPLAALLVLAACTCAAHVTHAQAPGIKRTILQRSDAGAGLEVILGMAEIAPGHAIGRHTHFGVETGYVLDGAVVMEVEGEPVRTLKAGESYAVAAGKIHDVRTLGDAPARALATYVVEKGKPLATPAK